MLYFIILYWILCAIIVLSSPGINLISALYIENRISEEIRGGFLKGSPLEEVNRTKNLLSMFLTAFFTFISPLIIFLTVINVIKSSFRYLMSKIFGVKK